MTTYGVKSTGFVAKPLDVILAELEAAMITQFGPNVIQTEQSPFGQLNGVFANLAAQLWERLHDVYQSYDPDEAEGVALDRLGRIRLINRNGRTDVSVRSALTNASAARVDLADILAAIESVDGVTFAAVFTNETNETDANGMGPGSVAVAVLGGDDDEVAAAIRSHVMPGIITFGNTRIDTVVDGLCRSVGLIRPIIVPVTLTVSVRLTKDANGCPPPAVTAIANGLVADWDAANINGKDVTAFTIRSLVESRYPQVEVVAIVAERDEIANQEAAIAFIEIASLDDVTVQVV